MEESYTPVIVCAAILAFAAWKTGWLSKLRANIHPTSARIAGNPQPAASQPPAAAIAPSYLDQFDTAVLGLAYQRAIKRDAENALAVEMAAKSHAEALARWQAPFAPPGGTPSQPPPGNPPKTA